MNNENLSKSIILIGPKGVGKSLIAENLSATINSGKESYFLLKLDLIRGLCQEYYENPGYFEMSPEELKAKILKTELKKINQEADFEEIKKEKEKQISKYVQEVFELNKIFDFKSFKNIISRMKQVYDFLEDSPILSNSGIVAFDNYISLQILEKCLQKINMLLIIDAGGNIGTVIDGVNDKDKFYVYELKDYESYQSKILSMIGSIVYLKPDEFYEKSLLSATTDEANKIYRNNPNSYKKYATATVEVSNLFTDPNDNSLSSRDIENTKLNQKRASLLNINSIQNICENIIKYTNQNQPK